MPPSSDRVPGIDERPQQREGGEPRRRIEIEHLDAGEVLACLGAEGGEVGVEAHRSPPPAAPPEQHADANATPPPRMAPATPRPMRSTSTPASSGSVSIAFCERNPMARPASSAPSTIMPARRRQAIAAFSRRSPVASGCCRHHASARQPPAPPARPPARARRSSAARRDTRTAGTPPPARWPPAPARSSARQGGCDQVDHAARRDAAASTRYSRTIAIDAPTSDSDARERAPRSLDWRCRRETSRGDGDARLAEPRCRRDSRADAADVRRRRSRERRARS